MNFNIFFEYIDKLDIENLKTNAELNDAIFDSLKGSADRAVN